MKTNQFKNIIWDLGGTLLDNYESSSRAFEEALGKFGKTAVHDEIYQALKVSTAYAIEKLAADLPDFLSVYKKIEAEKLEEPVLMPYAIENLKFLGRKHFMISHRDSQVLEILKKAHIDHYFIEVVTADNGFPRKPEADSINYLVQKYKLDPQKTVMIGDRELDTDAGKAANISTVFFDNEKTYLNANFNIKSLKELL